MEEQELIIATYQNMDCLRKRMVCNTRMEAVKHESEGEGHRCVLRLSRPVGSLLTAADAVPAAADCCCSVIRSNSSIAS